MNTTKRVLAAAALTGAALAAVTGTAQAAHAAAPAPPVGNNGDVLPVVQYLDQILKPNGGFRSTSSSSSPSGV